LHLAQKLGAVKVGRVVLDGMKLEANASKHKAMSYGRLIDKEERVEAEIAAFEAQAAALLADAEATDAAEAQIFGIGGKDADLPAELDRREKRPVSRAAAAAVRRCDHRNRPVDLTDRVRSGSRCVRTRCRQQPTGDAVSTPSAWARTPRKAGPTFSALSGR
jgi:hypothetical protein